MATQKLAKVVITANASTAKKVLEEIDALVQKYTEDIQKMTAAGQANTAECKKAESTLKALSQVQRDNIEDTKRLGEVVQDLANTKLRDLRRAMGSGKSALSKLTGSDDDLKRAEQIRAEMKLVGDEIRLIEGQYVNIAEGQKNVSNQSDQWLDKALKQQRDLVGSLQKSDASYQQNLATLKQLEAEEDRRKGKMGKQEAISTASNQSANASDLRRAKSTITEVRDMTDSRNVSEIEQYNKALQEIDKRLNSISGQYVDIQKGIGNVSNQSDQWLDKAIKQQRDLVGSLQKSDAEYQKNLSILKLLEAEEDRRRGKMSKQEAMATASNQSANASDLRRAKTTITEVRDMTDSRNVSEIEQYNKALQEIDKRLNAISGQFIDIQKGIGNVSNQSDQWLDKALKQQRDLVGSLEKSDASYQQNLATLKQLEAEEDRRKGKMSVTEARQTVSNGNASASDLRRAKATLTEARDNTPTGNSADIAKYNSELQEIEKRLEAVSGKAQKATMSWKEMRQVLSAPNKASGEDIKRTMEVIQQKIQQLPAGSKYVATLRRQYTMLEQTLKGTRMSQMALNDILTRSKQGKASLDELRRAYKQLEEELNQINTKSKEFADKQKSMKELKKNIDEVTGAVNNQGGAWQTAMKNLTAYVGLFSLFNKAKELVTGAIKKNFEYSGSLTDIRKVSGLTMEEVNKLSTELAKIDTRTSVDGLAQLAYQGAKLGMSKYGVEGMTQFVKAADKINVALGEELGEEALPALSKMVEVMGLIPKMGIEKAMDATGSAMFKLSTTSTATSNDIVEFSKRLTGVARTAGITTDQLLALGSASSSMMLMPEVASTAFGKFITALQKNHNLIAKELGIPDETIKNLYASGHAMDAMVLVFEKMRDKGNMNALGSIFKDLGSDGQRLVTAMVTMAKNVDMLKDHLYESEEAFREATAVSKEYEMQQQSAIGILERANNLWEKAFVNPDGVDAVKGMAEWWYEMSQTMTSSPLLKGTLQVALQMVLLALKAVATLLPVIIGYMASQGIYSGIMLIKNYGAAFGSAVKQMYDYITATRTATVAQTGLNSAMKLNPWIALASVVVAVAGAVYGYAQQAKEAARAEMEAAKRANEWKNNLNEAQSQTDTATRKLHSYKVAMENLNLSQVERSRQISQFNRDFRPYISKLGIEIKSVDDLRKNYKALAEEIQRATYYRLREKAKEDAMPAFQKDRLNAENRVKKALNYYRSRGSGFTSKGVMEMFAKGADANWIYQQIIKGDTPNVDENGIKFDGKTGRYSYTTKSGATVKSSGDKELLSSLRHYRNATIRERNKDKEINEYFSDFVPEGYTPWVEETPGTLENDAPEKGGGKTGSGGNTNTTEKNVAKDRANALIANIKAFYEEQMRKYLEWVTQMNADGEKISEGQQKEQMDYLESRMNLALGKARQSIATLDNGWKEFFQYMDEDVMVYDDETSKQLLESIGKSDVGELHELFTKLSGDLSRENNKTLSENLGALLDQIFANGSKELREAAEKLLVRQREIQKILNEHDYTGAVDRNTRSEFDRLGFLNPAKDIRTDSPEGLEKMNAAFDKLTTKARESITVLYSLNPESENFQSQFLQFLSVANDGFDFSKLTAQDLKALYLELIKYNDKYIAAEKQKYDEAKKLTNQKWAVDKRNLAQQERIRQIQEESNLFGKRTNLLSNLGLADLTADPEIELMKARMQAAEDYYAFVERNTKNKQLIDEAERARQEAELAYANQMASAMKSRLSQMKELVQPIEDFGSAVGKALAEMKYDAESANDAIKSALKSMLESWGKMAINDVNTQMWKAINDAGAKRAKKKAQPDIDAARANAKANAVTVNMSDIGTAGNPMHVIVDNGLGGDGTSAGAANVTTSEGGGQPVNGQEQAGASPASTQLGANSPQSGTTSPQSGSASPYTDVASQTGSAIADTVTGGTSLSDSVAGIGGGLVGDLMNTNFKVGGSSKKSDKEKKKQVKEEKQHQKELTREVKKGLKEREKVTDAGVGNITNITEEGNKEQSKGTEVAQQTIVNATDAALNATLTKKQQNNDATLQSDAQRTQGEVTFSIAGAMAKCFEFLGPIAGPIAAAVVMSTLMGLLQWALSSALGGGKNKNSSIKNPKNTKIVSGMLTYDSGNVQDLRPFVGNDGSLYWATEDNKPHDGVSLLTQPTATTINGQPSLVAENGPELVIGRETTKAMMMNNPQLLKALVNYDRNYSGRRAFDTGNITETATTIAAGTSASEESAIAQTTTNIALLQAVNTLLQRLEQPIEAKIDMYGRGKLYDSMTKADQFMKNK